MTDIEFYQSLGMKDEESEKIARKTSQYWNEGKWDNFIAPLLPKDCKDMTFLDIGCNCGLYLKMAKDWGFRDVIGVEKDRKTYERAIKFKEHIKGDYKILNREVGKDFDFDELPVADVTLLSNVHYHFKVSDWIKFLDKLQYKTRYCIIISSIKHRTKHWQAKTSIEGIRLYFREWGSAGARYKARYGWRAMRDTAPRKLHSHCFKSKLQRKSLDDLKLGALDEVAKRLYKKGNPIKELIEFNGTDLKKLDYYKAWKEKMKTEWSEEEVCEFVKKKVNNMSDIAKNGMKDAILIHQDNKILDGGHRVALMKSLGYKSIITRII